MAVNFFDGYKGYIHCDGFPGYDTLATKSPDIILSGCMYHARRKFFEITKIIKAKEGVVVVTRLSAVPKIVKHDRLKYLATKTVVIDRALF